MDSEENKVSIVLPTFNGEKYLRQSLESCLQQTHRNIELLIVDDCSTDRTQNIISSYDDKRLISIRHDRNRGLPHSLNSGFAAATGNYLTWTSDDNYYVPTAIEHMLGFLKKKKASFVYADYCYFTDDKNLPPCFTTLREPPLLKEHNGVGPCFLYTREVMNEVGTYDETAVLVEDYDYWLRVMTKFGLLHLNESLYCYRCHNKSLTSIYSRPLDMHILGTLARLKNNYMDLGQARQSLLDYIIERNGSLQCDMKSFRWHLINPKAYRKLLTSRFYSTGVRYRINKILKLFTEKTIAMQIARKQISAVLNKYA